MHRDEQATGFIEFAARADGAGAVSDEAWAQLRADADCLGFCGLMVAAACDEVPEIAPGVRDELDGPLTQDLADAMGDSGETLSLVERMDAFVEAKGERGDDLLARAVARVVYEVYDLSAHSFVQADVVACADLMAWAGPGQDAREAARRALRATRKAARSTIGHLDGQMDVVHALSRDDLPINYPTLDRILADYAPRVFAQRLPSLVKSLLLDDRQFRFVFVMWARMRGVVIGRPHLTDLATRIDPRRPMTLIEALEERTEVRAALRRAVETCPSAARVEAAFLTRTLPPL